MILERSGSTPSPGSHYADRAVDHGGPGLGDPGLPAGWPAGERIRSAGRERVAGAAEAVHPESALRVRLPTGSLAFTFNGQVRPLCHGEPAWQPFLWGVWGGIAANHGSAECSEGRHRAVLRHRGLDGARGTARS